MQATILQDGAYYDKVPMYLIADATFSASYTIPHNTGSPHIYSAIICAIDHAGNRTLVPVVGTCTQAADILAPVISATALSPTTLVATGGTVTVSATVTDTGGNNTGIDSVWATVYRDGIYTGQNFGLSNENSGNSYSGTFTIPNALSFTDHIYTVKLLATDHAGNIASALVTGACTLRTDNPGTAITAASVTPTTIAISGGTMTVKATVSGTGMTVVARIFRNSVPVTFISLSNGGSGSSYTGVYAIPINNTGYVCTFTAAVYATDATGLVSTRLADGTSIQNAGTGEGLLPVITNAFFGPSNLPSNGGTTTISATVTGTAPSFEVQAHIYRDGKYYTSVYLYNDKNSSVYKGSYSLGVNTDIIAHTFSAIVVARDAASRLNNLNATGSVLQINDNVIPLITNTTISTVTPINACANTLLIKGTITDAGAGVQSVQALIYCNSQYVGYAYLSQYDSSGSNYYCTFAISANVGDTANVWTASISATDKVNNNGGVPVAGSITQPFDSVKPIITQSWLTPGSRPGEAGSLNITAAVTDAGGIKSVSAQVRINNVYTWPYEITLSNGGDGSVYTGTYSFPANDTGQPKTYTALIKATDMAGNIATLTATGSCDQATRVTAVSTPAISTATLAPTSLPALGGNITISATITDTGGPNPGLQAAYIQLFRDGVYLTTLSPTGSDNVYSVIYALPSNSDQNTHYYSAVILAVDYDNNQSSVTATGTCRISPDHAAPSITGATQTPANITVSGGTITITANVTDANGVKKVYAYYFKNGVCINSFGLVNTSGNVYSGQININEVNRSSAPWTYSTVIIATDNLDNTATKLSSGTTTQPIDNILPSITDCELSPTTLPAIGGRITLTATITDVNGLANSGARIMRDGIEIDNVSFTIPGTLTYDIGFNKSLLPHVYTAVVYATDVNGNEAVVIAGGSTTQATDNSLPVLSNVTLTPATLPVTGGTFTISATVTDTGSANSGVKTVYATVMRDGRNFTAIRLDNGGSGDTYTAQITLGNNTDLIAHTYTAIVYANDVVGNTQPAVALGACVQAIDRTLPVISNATLTPTSRPATGGEITITATITDSGSSNSGLYYAQAYIYRNGAYHATINLSNGGSGSSYTGSFTFSANTSNKAITWTATVLAVDNVGNQKALPASGSCAQSTSGTVASGPTISGATIKPTTIPATGGQITLAATVTVSTGTPAVRADLFRDSLYVQTLNMSNGGSGTAYSASSILSYNHDTISHVYTATIFADDSSGKRTTVAATGSATQATNIKTPVITNQTILPAIVPFYGGTAKVSATITSSAGFQSVYADIFVDGIYWTYATLTKSGTSSTFTGNANIPVNTDLTAHVFTAVIYATDNTNLIASRTALGSCIQATDSGIPTQLIATPTITSFSPSKGPVGQIVTINGTNLTGAITVGFNGMTAASYTVLSATKITAVVASGSSTGKITVVTPGGTAVSTSSFTVVPPPSITSFSPTSGGIGTLVTITGANFTGATDVKFNGITATFTVVNDTQITATVATGTTTGKITVTTIGGTGTSVDAFTIVPAPTIFEFNPTSGGVTTMVTITGTDFTGASAVAFHDTPAASFTVVDNTTISAVVAAGTTTGVVSVTTPGGTATSVSTMVFTFFPTPTISGFTPSNGGVGTTVSISGTDFSSTTGVSFNGTPASFTVIDNSTITAIVALGTTSGPIMVNTMGGTATSTTSFSMAPAPTITSFTPSNGGVNTTVTINGTNLIGTTVVKFNGTDALSFTVVSAIKVTAKVAAGTTTGKITVTTPGGTATSSGTFSFVPAPTITSFTPTSGGIGTIVTINGSTLTTATAVKFNGVSAAFTVVNSAKITATVAAGTTTGKITITTAGGTATSTATFTFIPIQTITSFTPTSGQPGTVVTITGTDFTDVTNVKFNGFNAAAISIVNDTTLKAIVPMSATTGPITIVTTNGSITSTTNFTVILLPKITSFTPNTGTAGTPVTITGTGFLGASTVTFNGVVAGYTVVSNTQITSLVPSGATSGRIRVTTANGLAISATNFTIPVYITSFTGSGNVNSVITILGSGFTGASAVKFGAINATGFTVVSDTKITAVAPDAIDDYLTIVTPAGTATSALPFYYKPKILSFTPSSGPVGTLIAITLNSNVDLTHWNISVAFGAIAADVIYVDSISHIIYVPAPDGISSSTITVTSPGGAVTSTSLFTETP